jgi:glycosyltransferase involved in cell wall biosynthesis
MRLQEEAGHVVAPFAMHDERNEPTPWSQYFVSNLETKGIAPGFGAVKQFERALWSGEAKRNFGRLLDVFKPDMVHAHNLYTHLSPSPLAAAQERGIPVVMTVHDYALVSANYVLWDGTKPMAVDQLGSVPAIRTKFIKQSLIATAILEGIHRLHRATNAYDGVIQRYITCSSFVRDVMVTAGFSPKKISVLPPFAEPLIDPRASIFHDKKEDFVLFAGRLETYKGPQVLIEAAKYLPKGTVIKIAGVGPEEEVLKQCVPPESAVQFLGFVPGNELWRFMRKAKAVVVPSLWYEPFGLVALEAMCQGTPVIVSKRGGLPEIVGKSRAGFIVPPNDPRRLAGAIQQVVSDETLFQDMGDAARLRAEEIGNPQAHLAKVMEMYLRCG